MIALVMATLLQADELAAHREALKSLAPLVGRWKGGKGGEATRDYEKTFAVETALDGTVVTWRSKTVAGGSVVFEDLVVFSYDAPRKRVRARQWAFGTVATYDVEIKGKQIVMTETESEGGREAPWRYTIDLDGERFSYLVEIKEGDDYRPYIKHGLKKQK